MSYCCLCYILQCNFFYDLRWKFNLLKVFFSKFQRLYLFSRGNGSSLWESKYWFLQRNLFKQHYHDLKERHFFNGLCDILSFNPIIAIVRNDSTTILVNQPNKHVFIFLICVFCFSKIDGIGMGRKGSYYLRP